MKIKKVLQILTMMDGVLGVWYDKIVRKMREGTGEKRCLN